MAVSSHQSSKPLLQARGPDGCLIITTRGIKDLPDGCALPTPISPGHVKYGWSSDPQPFADPRIAAELKAAKIGRSPSKKITIQNVDDVPVVVQRSSLSFAGKFLSILILDFTKSRFQNRGLALISDIGIRIEFY